MSLTDIVHYLAENAINPVDLGFSAYVLEPKDYSIVPAFAFLSGYVTLIPRTKDNPYMKVLR